MAAYGRITRTDGQTVTESVMMMPLFLIFVFALLQLGHLGIGIAIVNYAASSVARQAVAQNAYNQGDAESKFNNILMAGFKSNEIKSTSVSDPENVTTNLKVTACAELPAYPLVGHFLYQAITSGSGPSPDACSGATKWLGPVGLKGPAPYHFIIQGQAVARMNYNAKGHG